MGHQKEEMEEAEADGEEEEEEEEEKEEEEEEEAEKRWEWQPIHQAKSIYHEATNVKCIGTSQPPPLRLHQSN